MSDLPVEKRFAVLCEITRAQHFAWRQAVAELCPGTDPTKVVDKMWQITGRQTAAAYVKHLDPTRPLAPQIADSIAWSSRCMGEDAQAEPGASPEEAYVRHKDCPWVHWHRRANLLAEDRPGCDAWFEATIAAVNQARDTKLRVATIEALPDGGASCLRRIWVET